MTARRPPPPKRASPAKHHVILFVGKDLFTLAVAGKALSPSSQVVLRHNPEQAREDLHQGDIDLIIIDADLGLTLRQGLEQDLLETFGSLPVIVLTGPDSQLGGLREDGSRCGRLLHIPKPFDKKALLEAVDDALRGLDR